MSKCKSCGKEIIWVNTKKGKSMPCDAAPIRFSRAEKGELFVTPFGEVVSGVRCSTSDEIGYISHFATCPNANQHKLPSAQPEFAKDTNVPSSCSEIPNSSDMVIRQDAINAQERKK